MIRANVRSERGRVALELVSPDGDTHTAYFNPAEAAMIALRLASVIDEAQRELEEREGAELADRLLSGGAPDLIGPSVSEGPLVARSRRGDGAAHAHDAPALCGLSTSEKEPPAGAPASDPGR